MKLKTNKLLTLTLATGLVAMTAGCGGSKTPKAAPTGGNGTGGNEIADVAYSAWSGSDDVTVATDDTANAFLAGVAATSSATVTLTGVTTGAVVETLNLAYEVTEEVDPVPGTSKGANPVTFGGAATNGVAFATNGDSTPDDLLYFAGVIAGADLGAPLTTTTAAGVWNGIFQAVGANAVEKDFILSVNFTDSEISGIVPVGADTFAADATSYYISGSYDDDGVITGNVLYRGFATATANTAPLVLAAAGTALETAIDADAEDTDTVGLATLSGLIGEDGALGAFYSSGSDGTGATGFAGGFVALTAENVGGDDPDVVYADWAAGAAQAAVITDNAFLVGTAKGLTGAPNGTTPETLDLAEVITPAVNGVDGNDGDSSTAATPGTAGTDGVRLGGADTNGVAFFTTGATTEARYFAGLHSTTDLGAPISAAPTTAIWNGLFQAVGAGDYATAAKAFALTVTYSATADSTIIGLVGANDNDNAHAVADDTSYYISGTYDANGVITGNILYGDFSAAADDAAARTAAGEALTDATATTDGLGVLSGLIGANGAVGAFYSNAEDATDGYAGGFVVSTTANAVIDAEAGEDGDPYIADVAYAAWSSATTTVGVATANAFLASTGTDVLDFTALSPVVVPVIVSLSTGAGGATFFETVDGANAFYLAGIHSDTNLGKPVTATTVGGTWSGTFGAVGNPDHTTTGTTFTLAVTFGTTDGNTITALVPANNNTDTFTTAGDTSYYISGTYNAAGVITGNVLYSDFTAAANDGAARDAAALALTAATATSGSPSTVGLGTLTGLIGASGAVGAFYSSGSDSTGASGYAGGFAVTRTPPANP